jgi:nucleoredoxin
MRRQIFGVLFLFVLAAQAGQLPMTVKDISLMLRTGYSSDAVTQEVARRYFADTLDAEKETSIRNAGASDDLVAALKNGKYSLDPKQMAEAQQKIVGLERRRVVDAEISRSLNPTLRTQKRAIVPTISSGNKIQELLKGDLVSFRAGALTRADDDALESKKLIGFYFSAHWCGPCRKFTPQLVDYYNRIAAQHPEFEIVFVSDDRSALDMETYMREANMPWPAIDFQKLAGKDAIKKYAGSGIPCLVIVDANGNVVSDSYAGKQYRGPQKVLSDLDAIFSGKLAPQVTAAN